MASTDKYAVYQDWINTLNPDTAAEGRRALALEGLDTEDPFNNPPPVDQPSANAFDPDQIRAIRMQGGNEFSRLVAAGVPAPDALAKVAGKLFYNDPAGMTRAVNPNPRRSTTPPLPGSAPRFQTNVDPVSGKVISYSVLNPDGRVQSTMRATVPTMPQDVKVSQQLKEKNIDDLRRQINTDYRKVAKDDDEDAKRRIIKNRETLSQLEAQMQEGSTNWMSRMTPVNSTTPPMPFNTQTFTESGPEGLSIRQLPVARVAPAAPMQPTAAEIERKTPSGRIAIFDGATKKFLRWK